MTKKAVLYLRVSTERQAERDLSIPNQRRQIEAFCKREGLKVVQEFSDAGVSARSDRRPEFQKMVAAAGQKPRPFDEVVVYSWSRFFRDATESLFYIRKFERLGVRVRAVTADVPDDASGRLLRTILAATDEHASEMIAERVLGGMEENVRRGYVNGIAPYGFRSVAAGQLGDKIKKRFEPDPREKRVVEDIFELYLKGSKKSGPMGIKRVVEHLNVRGLRQRHDKPFSISFVHRLLTSTTCIGVYVWNKRDSRTGKDKPEADWIRVEIPPIIDRKTFDAVQAKLARYQPMRTPPRRANTPILLSGLIYCGHCGKALTRGAGKNKKYKYYFCSGKSRGGSAVCRGQWLSMPAVDHAVTNAFVEQILEPSRLTELLRQVQAGLQKNDGKTNTVKRDLEAELKRTQRELDNLVGAVARGVLNDDDARQQIVQRRNEIDSLRAKINDATSPALSRMAGMGVTAVKQFAASLRKAVTTGNIRFRQAYLRIFIERIEAAEKKLTISGLGEALAAAAVRRGPELDGPSVHAFVQEWCSRRDSNA